LNNIQSPDSSDSGIERDILAKGLTAPRVTPADIDANILAEQFHVFPGTMLTVCVLTLRNGFTVTGESACASPENFDAEIGRKIARANAVQKIWPLMGYQLKETLYQTTTMKAE
jgi:N4 Gp49/Sf6 Gp66 family protein